ncbi:interleukin-12 subunit beta [Brachionichthys hirsutus]|uniref:interleukin-12 subunit beta n=1 Tax=Brachionichthys hirsutus TaxID=412623 RepID=UPI003605356D
MLLLVPLIYTMSCVCSVSTQDQPEVLMKNVLVLRVPHEISTKVHVPLTCGEAHQNKLLFWKKNGLELEPALQGNKVKVLVEDKDGGNYTCHLSKNGEYLNHTVIMVRLNPDNRLVILEKQSPEEGHIHCSAPNYTGSFQCTWKKTRSRSHAAVLLVKAEWNLEQIPCELNADGSGLSCQHANCPYREEKHGISLTVYMYSYALLEAYKKAFYLRDIVRPEKVPNLRIINGNFSWSYPDSWEKPCTYFRLHFQVKMVRNKQNCDSEDSILHTTSEETTYKVDYKTRKYVFCVRAQDRYTNGPFSPWSHCIVKKPHLTCQPEP